LADLSAPAVRKLAAEILARREFDAARPTKFQTTFQQWLNWFISLLDRLAMLHETSPTIYWMIMALMMTVLAVIVTHIVVMIRAALRVTEPPAKASTQEAPPDLAARAESLAAAGRYLEAAHWMMIASFRALGERSVIELRPDRSNAWIRAALAESELPRGLSAEIAALVARTERRWFGERADEPDIYAQWRSAFERLHAAGI
jgi:hypothetical protein